MREWSVSAVLTSPIGRCPRVMVTVADAGVTGCYPIFAAEMDLEELIYVLVDDDISVKEDASVVGSQFESTELRPSVFEAPCY